MAITFRDSESSDALRAIIDKRIEKLRSRFGQPTHVDVVVSEPHRHQHKGKRFHVRVEFHVPGHQAVVDRDPNDPAHEDAYVAVRDAFDAIEKQLAHATARPPHPRRHTGPNGSHIA